MKPAFEKGEASIRVLLCDDHPSLRWGIRSFLESAEGFDVVGEAGDGAQALALASKLRPDVVLLDLYMPVMDGMTTLRRLREELPSARVVVLTQDDSEAAIQRAVDLGATGYLLKGAGRDEVCSVVRIVAVGEGFYRPRPRTTSQQSQDSRPNPTDGDKRILRLMAQGLTNDQIARAEHVSKATAKRRIQNACFKLGVPNNNRTLAVNEAHKRGYL